MTVSEFCRDRDDIGNEMTESEAPTVNWTQSPEHKPEEIEGSIVSPEGEKSDHMLGQRLRIYLVFVSVPGTELLKSWNFLSDRDVFCYF